MMEKSDLATFDPNSEFAIVERTLPHWSQAGTVCFITWRLADSLPHDVLQRLDREIVNLLSSERLPTENWKSELAKRDRRQRGRVQWKLFQIRDKYMDVGSGDCWLSQPKCAQVVLDSLLHFDQQHYLITDAVIMPNHVHFLCAFAEEELMLKQCENWKRYTARTINKLVNRCGSFWQVDQFDHLVRSPEQFEHYRRYVKDNPIVAKLKADQFLYYQTQLEST